MTPVHQTIFGEGTGNCFAACIATILDIPVEEVPNFACMDGEDWFERCINWLWERGYGMVYLYPPPVDPPPRASAAIPLTDKLWSQYPYIITAKSPRGDFYHSAVGKHRNIIHDPHPDGTGFDGPWHDIVLIVPRSDALTQGNPQCPQ